MIYSRFQQGLAALFFAALLAFPSLVQARAPTSNPAVETVPFKDTQVQGNSATVINSVLDALIFASFQVNGGEDLQKLIQHPNLFLFPPRYWSATLKKVTFSNDVYVEGVALSTVHDQDGEGIPSIVVALHAPGGSMCHSLASALISSFATNIGVEGNPHSSMILAKGALPLDPHFADPQTRQLMEKAGRIANNMCTHQDVVFYINLTPSLA